MLTPVDAEDIMPKAFASTSSEVRMLEGWVKRISVNTTIQQVRRNKVNLAIAKALKKRYWITKAILRDVL